MNPPYTIGSELPRTVAPNPERIEDHLNRIFVLFTEDDASPLRPTFCVLHVVTHTMIERIRSGLLPVTRTGDYSDVTVIDATGRAFPGPTPRNTTTTPCAI